MNKGQIPVMVAIIGAVATVFVSFGGAWVTSSTKVAVIEERENLHYGEVQKQLIAQEKKIDEISIILRAAPWNKTK